MASEIINFLLENDIEDFESEDFDASQAQDVRDVDAHALADMKVAEPEFFSRSNTKFFGTQKIYQYGHFLVLKNRRKRLGHFGNIDYHTSFVVYEFKKTADNPQGILLSRGSTSDLSDAKFMIKHNDFRSRYERARDSLAKPAVAEAMEPQITVMSPEEAKERGHDIGEIEEFPIKRLSVPGSHIDFEESDAAIWILGVGTDEGSRRQGLAKGLLQFIADYAKNGGKRVIHGSFTDDGEKYLRHVVDRIWSGMESDEDEFDADLAKEIGTPDPMPNWRDHNVLRETKSYALVTFQNGKTGLICLVPNHSPERVRIKRPQDIKYLMSTSDSEFDMSACMEYGCGVWATSDEESEEIERDLNDGG